MALPSSYYDPGVVLSEVISPGAISLATVPDVLAIVAIGNRSKRSTNEGVVRGQVFEEALTVAGASPHTALLVNRGDRRISNTTVRRTVGTTTINIPNAGLTYLSASLTGTAAGPYNLSTDRAIGFKMDGGQEITIQLRHNAAPGPVVITGTLVLVEYTFSGAGGNAATRAQIAAAINLGLAAATSLGYGTSYAAVVTDVTTGIKFTSPLLTSASDVQILIPFDGDATALFGFTAPTYAVTRLQIADIYYDSSATWQADYVAVNTAVDPLANTATQIVRVGSFANVTSFFLNTDYIITSNNIDWSPDTASSFAGSSATPFDVSTNYNIRLAFDGKSAITFKLDGLASPPPGYANPAIPAAATVAEIVKNINAIISVAAGYGPRYRAVASVYNTNYVKLTSPTQGGASAIEIYAATTLDATQEIFGLLPAQMPLIVLGTGSSPSVGVLYFVTYDYDRTSDDYNTPKRYFNENQMTQDLTPVSSTNTLSTYGQIAFENGAPSIVVSQINDMTTPGVPTVNEVKAAIDGLNASSVTTDVLVADTRLSVQTYLINHVETQSSVTEKNYRTGWFGMPVGTDIGSVDTPDTFVYRSVVTLQVAPDSPARGRLILIAPDSADRTITLEDGVETTLSMDSTALACAIAARHTSFTSPAVSLASKTITGFNLDTFPTYLRAERGQLASNGVMVVTNDGGVLRILDPITTEAGGGKMPKFMFREAASQKDNVSRAVEKVVKNNLVGVVPDDLADFIFDIKLAVASVLSSLIQIGAIGPFRDANGVSRDIDIASDVQAEQSTTDPTKYRFNYFYFLRYPALRFEGQFSVDSKFF